MQTMSFNQLKEFEMSTDGGQKWEKIRLPANCHPHAQCVLFGSYQEGEVLYRTSSGGR